MTIDNPWTLKEARIAGFLQPKNDMEAHLKRASDTVLMLNNEIHKLRNRLMEHLADEAKAKNVSIRVVCPCWEDVQKLNALMKKLEA